MQGAHTSMNGTSISQKVWLKNDKVKILWDFNIYVNWFLEAKGPDTVVVDKEEECVIIDIPVPADQNIEVKETEKMEK